MGLCTHKTRIRYWILNFVTAFVFSSASLVLASELIPKINKVEPGINHSTPIEISVRGASAGITTEYYEQTVVDAINAGGLFADSENQQYSLDIRIVKVETPSFGKNMTVTMKVVWKFYRSPEKTPLLKENILSTYTGGVFEGGLVGANRVRVAMEGAARESVSAGMELLASINLEKL